MESPKCVLGAYRAEFECPSFSRLFPEIEADLRLVYPASQGYSVRTAKRKEEWSVFVFKGATRGFQIDFKPVPKGFDLPRVAMEVRRSSRLFWWFSRVGACLVAGAFICYLVAKFLGLWDKVPGDWVFYGFVAAVALLGGSSILVGLLMHIGGRLTDSQLATIGQDVADRVRKAVAAEGPLRGS
jgi:hypothetical protein